MKELEEALKYFDLKENFTEEELNKAYKEKQNIIYVDFKEKKRNKEVQDDTLNYNYQLVKIYQYIQQMLKDIKVSETLVENVTPEFKKFYTQEQNNFSVKRLFFYIRKDIQLLDGFIKASEDLATLDKAFVDFKSIKDNSYRIFIDDVLKRYYNKEENDKETDEELRAFTRESIIKEVSSVKDVMNKVEYYSLHKNEAMNEYIDKTYPLYTKFSILLREKYKDPSSPEHRLGIKYFLKMRTAKTEEEAQEIYEEAIKRLFYPSEDQETELSDTEEKSKTPKR